MRVYRLAKEQYITDVSGVGAQLFGGRWNPKGVACLYTSEYLSLALLEKFIHAQGKEDMRDLMLLEIELPENEGKIYHTDSKKLEWGWADDVDYSQWLGEQILAEPSIVAFSVPSVIVPSERNIIINPRAENFGEIRFSKPKAFSVDKRLLGR